MLSALKHSLGENTTEQMVVSDFLFVNAGMTVSHLCLSSINCCDQSAANHY